MEIPEQKEGAKMPEDRIRVAPNTVAYADRENHKLVVEFAIPGAPTETIDVKILEDSVHLTAPARDIEYVAALALGWHLRHMLLSYLAYYNGARTHLSLNKDAPVPRAVQAAGRIHASPILGGLHHQYVRI